MCPWSVIKLSPDNQKSRPGQICDTLTHTQTGSTQYIPTYTHTCAEGTTNCPYYSTLLWLISIQSTMFVYRCAFASSLTQISSTKFQIGTINAKNYSHTSQACSRCCWLDNFVPDVRVSVYIAIACLHRTCRVLVRSNKGTNYTSNAWARATIDSLI